MRVLAIETSCDDTSLAIISYDGDTFVTEQLLSYTQVIHNQYGGVVPELASREHADQILAVFKNIVNSVNSVDSVNSVVREQDVYQEFFQTIDAIAYTSHPGLPGSLVVGEAFAKTLALQYGKELWPTNHVHGHLFSLFLERKIDDVQLPMVVLTASGGHNDLYYIDKRRAGITGQPDITTKPMEGHSGIVGQFQITKLGGTLDDASGECFDKVARMLGGTYPGGPWISKQALEAVPDPSISFTRIFLKADEHMFSFSGMKAQIHTFLETCKEKNIPLTPERISAIAWEFQEAVVEVLAKKLIRAGLVHHAKTVAIAGGVSANQRLREYTNFLTTEKKRLYNQVINAASYVQNSVPSPDDVAVPVVMKPMKLIYSMDNGAMIGAAAIMKHL